MLNLVLMSSLLSADTRFRLDPAQAHELAAEFGTPLYVVDETHLRNRIREYWQGFRAAWPRCAISFASKANSTLALLSIAASEGCDIDVASEGEMRAALRAGVHASRCHLHGNNKSSAEIAYAIAEGVGQIMVDNFQEIALLAEIAASTPLPKLVLRLAPGVDPVTHAKISTGQADTKFGFNISNGSAERAVTECQRAGLPLIGFHCHVGSQLLDPEAQTNGGAILAQFAVDMLHRHDFRAELINVGGGLGVRYLDSDHPTPIADYCRMVVEAMQPILATGGLDPVLAQEPGRSLVAESGVTLYRIGVRKTVPSPTAGQRTYLCVDGGLSDNPRPALYGSKYTVLSCQANPAAESAEVRISGKHCETDLLFDQVTLPANIDAGDLLQILCTGAYNSSMANNYNRFPRPATVLLRSYGAELVQRRDTWDEMFARELLPEDLNPCQN